MYYIIIPKKAGETPDSWYAYLLTVGPMRIFLEKPQATAQQLVLQFFCLERAVRVFDDAQVFNQIDMTFNFVFVAFEQLRFELCDNAPLELLRLNTNHFYHQAWRLPFNYQNDSILIGRKTYYLLCSGLFKSPPVSISRCPNKREILYYNEKSPTLNDCFEGLCTTKLLRGEDNLLHNLTCLANYVCGIFECRDLERINAISADDKNKSITFMGAQPTVIKAVNLTRFINEGVGVCRHNAMLVCYLMQRLQQQEWIPAGEIIHFRVTMKKVGHSFVLFRTANHHEIFVVDSTHNKVYHLPIMRAAFCSHYNQEIYATIRANYLIEAVCDPTLPLLE